MNWQTKFQTLDQIIIFLKQNTNLPTTDIYKIIRFIYEITNNEIILNKSQKYKFTCKTFKKIQRFIKYNYPLEYSFNKCNFLNNSLYIKKPVLIPRPETEELAIHAIKKILDLNIEIKNALEIGVGTGAIIQHLGKKFPKANFIGIDKLKTAFNVAVWNCKLLLNIQIKHKKYQKFIKNNKTKFNLIISNPPYVALREIKHISKTALLFENKYSLFAKNSGLYFYKIFFNTFSEILDVHFVIALEFGFQQKNEIEKLFKKSNLSKYQYQFLKDDNKKYRIILIWN